MYLKKKSKKNRYESFLPNFEILDPLRDKIKFLEIFFEIPLEHNNLNIVFKKI